MLVEEEDICTALEESVGSRETGETAANDDDRHWVVVVEDEGVQKYGDSKTGPLLYVHQHYPHLCM